MVVYLTDLVLIFLLAFSSDVMLFAAQRDTIFITKGTIYLKKRNVHPTNRLLMRCKNTRVNKCLNANDIHFVDVTCFYEACEGVLSVV